MDVTPATMMKGLELVDKQLEDAFRGIPNVHYCTLLELARSAVCHRKSLLEAWKAMVNNTSIFINNLGMKGILNHILAKGTDPVQLSFIEFEMNLRKEAHERMLREIEQQASEEAPGSKKGRRMGKSTRRENAGGSPSKKNRPSGSYRK